MLHVETTGHGAPIVLLHGWAMHSGLWGPLVGHLARRRRVHAVDLPGHGMSSALEPFTLETIVAALDARFAGDGFPLTVVGWSLGGMAALHWATAGHARIERLVLISTTPRFVSAPDWPHGVGEQTLRRFGDEVRVAWKETIQRFLALQLRGSSRGHAVLGALKQTIYARGEPSPRMLAQGLALLHAADLRAEAATIDAPALVIAGSRDTLTPPAAGEWLSTTLPDARFVLIEGAGHLPFLSHPEAVTSALDRFLDGR